MGISSWHCNMRGHILLLVLALAIGGGKAKSANITSYHVNTKIQFRYAITEIEVGLKNFAIQDQDAVFELFIPKTAFVSNFSLEINGKDYLAKVQEKNIAKKVFENSKEKASGLVSAELDKEKNRIFFSAKLRAFQKATYKIKYEERLERISLNGKFPYTYDLDIFLKNQDFVNDFSLTITIDESMPVKWEDLEFHRIIIMSHPLVRVKPLSNIVRQRVNKQKDGYFN